MTNELTTLCSIHDEIKEVAPTWYGLEDLSCLPADFFRAIVSPFVSGEGWVTVLPCLVIVIIRPCVKKEEGSFS